MMCWRRLLAIIDGISDAIKLAFQANPANAAVPM
jgi:hypothetical protein